VIPLIVLVPHLLDEMEDIIKMENSLEGLSPQDIDFKEDERIYVLTVVW